MSSPVYNEAYCTKWLCPIIQMAIGIGDARLNTIRYAPNCRAEADGLLRTLDRYYSAGIAFQCAKVTVEKRTVDDVCPPPPAPPSDPAPSNDPPAPTGGTEANDTSQFLYPGCPRVDEASACGPHNGSRAMSVGNQYVCQCEDNSRCLVFSGDTCLTSEPAHALFSLDDCRASGGFLRTPANVRGISDFVGYCQCLPDGAEPFYLESANESCFQSPLPSE